MKFIPKAQAIGSCKMSSVVCDAEGNLVCAARTRGSIMARLFRWYDSWRFAYCTKNRDAPLKGIRAGRVTPITVLHALVLRRRERKEMN